MNSRTVFRSLSLLLGLLLLVAFAGCRQKATDEGGDAQKEGATATEGNQDAQSPEAPGGRNQGGRRRPAKAHVTLAGAVTFEGDTAMGCGPFGDKGLEFNFDQTGTQSPQVQIRIATVNSDGEYPATVVIHEQPASGAAREWTGSAKVQLKSHIFGGARKRTGFNGTFTGSYQGQGGTGTLNGEFKRCILRELAQ